MKIVHIVSYFSTKYRYQEFYLAQQQVKDGHTVTVVTSERNYPFPDYQNTSREIYGERKLKSGEYLTEGISVIRLPVIIELRTRVVLKGLKRTINKTAPDYILVHGLLNFSAIYFLLRKPFARLIFDEHMLINQIDKSIPGKVLYLFYRMFLSKLLIKRAEKIVAISEGCIPTLNTYFGVPLNRIIMIPLGAESDLFKYDPIKRIQLRQKFGIGSDEIVLIYTGKVIKNKAPHKILEALKAINTSKKVCVLIVGNGAFEYKSEIETLAKASDILCILHPQVTSDELPAFFSASDIAIYPTEATISTIEASSCSLPVICTNEIPERYKNNNGIGISPGDVVQLKNAMEKLINDDHLRSIMGKNAREYVEKELSWEVISEKFLK